ncbi:hypothetical protein [Streptomyces sp. NPDC048496]|uniref:hypothetical protein n=1 Tax=Streptomyces sp. NPDC048496 TaxID=3365558 RepID=UPI00371C76DA
MIDSPLHAEFAARLAQELGAEDFTETVRVLERLSVAVDAVTDAQPTPPSA